MFLQIKDGTFSLVVEEIIKFISQLVQKQYQFDNEHIEPIMQKFLQLLEIKYYEESKNITSTKVWNYNGYIINQHKFVFDSITHFNANYPREMLKFAPFLMESSRQSFDFQDYVRVFKFSMSIFVCLMQNQQLDEAYSYYQECKARLVAFLTTENRAYLATFNEGQIVLQALMLVLQKTEADEALTQQFIQFVNQFAVEGSKGVRKYMASISSSKFSQEDRVQLYKNEMDDMVVFCLDYSQFLGLAREKGAQLDQMEQILQMDVEDSVKSTFLFFVLKNSFEPRFVPAIAEMMAGFFDGFFLQPQAELIIECMKNQSPECQQLVQSILPQLEEASQQKHQDEWLFLVLVQFSISSGNSEHFVALKNSQKQLQKGRRKLFGILLLAVQNNRFKPESVVWLVNLFANATWALQECSEEFWQWAAKNKEGIIEVWEALDAGAKEMLQ